MVGTVEFDDVFRDSFRPVVRTVYLVTGDWEVARELSQDAFVQLLRHWRKVSQYDNPGAWTRRVAIRLAMRERDRPRAEPVRPTDDGPDIDAELDLRRALLELTPPQRAAIALRYLADLPTVDIAEVLGCTESTARTHLQRGRQRLAELLDEEVEHDAR